MAALAEIMAQVLADCDALPLADLHEIAEWIDDEAAPFLYRLGAETLAEEPGQAVAVLGQGREALDEALQLMASAIAILRAYCAQQLSAAPPAGPVTSAVAQKRVESRDEQIVRIRRELPSPVDRSRTMGRWIDRDGGEHELKSGEEDEWFDEAARFARERRMVPPFGKPMLARHVEIKFAMRMRRNRLTRELIVIDRPALRAGRSGTPHLSCQAW